jgi:hypothetical protein
MHTLGFSRPPFLLLESIRTLSNQPTARIRRAQSRATVIANSIRMLRICTIQDLLKLTLGEVEMLLATEDCLVQELLALLRSLTNLIARRCNNHGRREVP